MKKLFICLVLITIGCYRLQAQNIDLFDLNQGQTRGISIASWIGTCAMANYAGDVNNDGFNDLLFWSDFYLYLIYGSDSTSEVTLANFTSTQGFLVNETNPTFTGVGDVNGDKIDDIMFSTIDDCSVCVIFGSQQGVPDITSNLYYCGDASLGIRISGLPANYMGAIGTALSAAGDVNGDGMQDMLIAANAYPLNRSNSGVAFVVFGNEDGLTNIDLGNLDSTQGFEILGPANNSYLGNKISGAGDVNGDGIDDIILGAGVGFPAYVLYGNANGFSDIDLANFESSQGFTISLTDTGKEIIAISSAGDVNGDNIDDLIFGVNTRNSSHYWAYVLYGSQNMPFNVNISNITSAQGFAILTDHTSGFAQFVTGLGDFNQDGLDDVAVAAYRDDHATGATYVIFGAESQPENIKVETLSSPKGIVITGPFPGEMTGYSVNGIGDFNGDHIPDIGMATCSPIIAGYVVYSPFTASGNQIQE